MCGYTSLMQIVGHGIDIIRCDRIVRIWRDHGDRFLARVYTPAERGYCLDCKTPAIRLSGRFAAKEAVLKVLGTGWRGGLQWTDIEVLPDPLGKPLVTLHGAARDLAATLGIQQILLSISHTGEHAVASALGVGPRP
jgi:holo-[acyl-carrier protein] synthase